MNGRTSAALPWYRSTPVRLTVLGFLILILLIPTGMIRGLIQERQQRQRQVEQEVAGLWGGEQCLLGPVLLIPYRVAVAGDPRQTARSDTEKPRFHRGLAHLLPARIAWTGRVAPQVRYRGLFEVVVYEVTLHAEGVFRQPDATGLDLDGAEVEWERSAVAIGLPDLRGIQDKPVMVWHGAALELVPGTAGATFMPGGLNVTVGDPRSTGPADGIPFAFDLVLRGSHSLRFLPIGEETVVELESSWPSPSFAGAFLPREREVTAAGFAARWRVPYFGRGYPQVWRTAEGDGKDIAGQMAESAFGVDLFMPADGYQQTERSIKYAVLFILLTFLTFFLLEVFSPVCLHPMQYLLVGFALCLFYLLLLALSEHLGFGPAYLIGSAAIVHCISGYAWSILGARRQALVLWVSLASLYAFLYTLLQAEDYSLVMGAVGLFVILVFVMFVTRRVDWYTLEVRRRDAIAD